LLHCSLLADAMGRQQDDAMMQLMQLGDNRTMWPTGHHNNAANRIMQQCGQRGDAAAAMMRLTG
jgi:hypothetical protein